jgi:aminopeptidase N
MPYPRLAVLQLPAPWPRGETVAAPGALLFDAAPPDVARLAHELAHQWWGMAVQTPMLEGLATYAEWRFGPHRPDPGGAYLDFVTRHTDQAIRDALYRFEEPERRALAYDKLAAVLMMLEDVMGAERFARLLREFQRTNLGRRTRLEEFQAMARRISRQDLDAFFNQWVHQPGLPGVRLEPATARAEGGNWQLTLPVSQAAPPFRVAAVLAVATAAGSERHTVELAGISQQVVLTCRGRPIGVELDPDRRLLLNRRESQLKVTVMEVR